MSRHQRSRKKSSITKYKPYSSNDKRIESKIHDAPLNEVGLSVFRRINTGELDDCSRVFSEYTNNLLTIERNTGQEYGLAINLMGLYETKLKKFIGSISVQEALDEIYDSVPTLKKPLTLKLNRVALFGKEKHVIRSVGAVIHKDDRGQLKEERNNIIKVLSDYTSQPLTRNDWDYNNLPHISVGRIHTSGLLPGQQRVLFNRMNETLPDVVHIDRATLHNPSR